MKYYRIANWEALYETYETKKLANLKWVPTRNKHDGLGFRRMAAQKNRCELFAAWNLILQVASKGRREADRGKLCRDGKAIAPDDLAIMTGFPASIFEIALTFFSAPEMGWLVVDNQPPTEKTAEPPVQAGSPPALAGCPPVKTAEPPAEGIEGRKEGIQTGGDDVEVVPSKYSKARIALFWLNERTGRRYRETDVNLSLIAARLEEVQNDIEGVKAMIDRQCVLWKGKEQEEYLRPETLFGKQKFGGYYDSRYVPVPGLRRVESIIAARDPLKEAAHLDLNLPNSPV